MGGVFSGILDRMAASDVFDELRDLPLRTVHRGFQTVHVGVGTSDLTDEAASFWFLDTQEIVRFFVLMMVYAMVFTFQLWSYLAHMRWGYFPLQTPADDDAATLKNLAMVHVASVACGWTMWLGVASLVAYRQYRDSQANGANEVDPGIMPKLARRVAPSVWAPLDRRLGVWRHPLVDTRPQAWRFAAPIIGIHDGKVLYSQDELIDELIFGDSVEEEVRDARRKWKQRLQRWRPPTVRKAFDWALARRAIMQDYAGHMSPPKPKKGRYFIDYDEEAGGDEPMRGKDLRRIVWIMMWLPCGTAAICETVRNWSFVTPQTPLAWLAFVFSLLSAVIISWLQISIFGAKFAESQDRESDDTENVFSAASRLS